MNAELIGGRGKEKISICDEWHNYTFLCSQFAACILYISAKERDWSAETRCLCSLPLLLAVISWELLQSSFLPLEGPCSPQGCSVRAGLGGKEGVSSMPPDWHISKKKTRELIAEGSK